MKTSLHNLISWPLVGRRKPQRILTLAVLVLLSPSLSGAHNWQFSFDARGSFMVQSPETNDPPQILAQPQSQLAASHELASFFVVVANTRDLSFRWQFNGTNLPSANTDALLLFNVGATNEGSYSVVVMNPSGSVTSS